MAVGAGNQVGGFHCQMAAPAIASSFRNFPFWQRWHWVTTISRRPSGLRKTKSRVNSLAHRTTWLRSDLGAFDGSWGRQPGWWLSLPNGCAGDRVVLSKVSVLAEVALGNYNPFSNEAVDMIPRRCTAFVCTSRLYSSSNVFSTCRRGSTSSCVQSHGPSFQF